MRLRRSNRNPQYAPHLVSFRLPDGGLGSDVVSFMVGPPTWEAVEELQHSLRIKHDPSIVLHTWHILPGTDDHPSVDRGYYCYNLMFELVDENGIRSLSSKIWLQEEHPLCSAAELLEVERQIRVVYAVTAVHLISCQAMQDAPPELIRGF